MKDPVNLLSKFEMFSDHWSPKVIAEMNDYQFKLVKLKGSFVRHNHEETDEVFIVIEGSMHIELSDNTVEINQGEMAVVPRGQPHRPFATEECKFWSFFALPARNESYLGFQSKKGSVS